MNAIDERLLTRNGLAARQLAATLLTHEENTRLPRLRDVAEQLGVGNGTVQAAFQLLEGVGAIRTVARGHLGTFLVEADRAVLWRLSGMGTLLAAMPLPYSRRYEGLATGLRTAFEQARTPFAVTFMRGAHDRVAALLEHKVDLVVLSRFAADRLMGQHPLELVADLGPSTYVGAHGILVRRGVDPVSHGLRVAVDRSSEDLELLTERAFAGRPDLKWVEASYMQLPDLFARGEVDATVWNLDEVQGRMGEGVDVLPLSDEILGELSLRNARAAIVGRAEDRPLGVVRQALDPDLITGIQQAVLRGDLIPSY
ncbi:GntR family transcriptional regulator YhfZ [Streptomyces sp. NPDC005438]|uniref:GntR family transcriptional regulator YhfZ n=1 Tax=Streptomyces sp. NPDC005438 TaxID=3156880 RepID=UPI0033A3966E